MLSLELAHIEVVIEALLGKQLVVCPPFVDLTVVDHQDLVCLADGAQAVGDDKAGPSLHQAQHRFLDVLFSARVYAARRFVQDKDAGIGKNGAGDGQQLSLALAEVAGSL